VGYEEVGHYLELPPTYNNSTYTGLPPLTAHLWFNPLPETLLPGGTVYLAISGINAVNIIDIIDFAQAYSGTYFGVSTAANSRIYTTDIHGDRLQVPLPGFNITYRIIQ
jgi:hypothetical protein